MKPFIPREWIRMRKQPEEHPWSRLSSYKMHMTIKQTSKGPYLRVCHTIKENPIPDGVQWIKVPFSPGEVCWVREVYECEYDLWGVPEIRYKEKGDEPFYQWLSPVTMPQKYARRHVRIISCVPEQRGEWGWKVEWEDVNLPEFPDS